MLSDGIYHIDSFILDAPKAVICVGLQDDYKLSYRSGYEPDYPASGHDNVMSIEGDDEEDNSLTASFEDDSYSTQSEYKNSIDSIKIHENCCRPYANCQLNETHHAKANATADGIDVNDDAVRISEMAEMKHVFDNDEFIIVPHAAQTQLITSHCTVHSGLMILAQPENDMIATTPPPTTTSDSCDSSPAPSSGTANTTNSSPDSNYIPANNAATASTATGSALTTSSCYRDDTLHFQCFMQKCAH